MTLPSLAASLAAGPLTYIEREQQAAAAAAQRLPSPEPMDEAAHSSASGSQWDPQTAGTTAAAPIEAEAVSKLQDEFPMPFWTW